METETGMVGGWGLVLAVAAGLLVGCAPRTEIGEAEALGGAGAGDVGGSAGRSAASVSGNAGQAGSDSAEVLHGCFELMTADDPALGLGPNNQVFPSIARNTSPLRNYADQLVFAAPNWELDANFAPSTLGDDTSIQLPDELSRIPENVGEVRIMRPECAGVSTAGRTVRVYAWWKVDGAIARTPTEGLSLGTSAGESFVDSINSSLVGDSQQTRPLNTLAPIVLEHHFSTSDTTDAGDLVLKVWLLETFEFPSTLYINRVEWQ